MKKSILNLYVLCALFTFINLMSLQSSAQSIDTVLYEEDSDLDLFLWFAELDEAEADALANKDPDELELELQKAEKLLTKTDESIKKDTSINESAPTSLPLGSEE